MKNQIKDVELFHQTFGAVINTTPTNLDKSVKALRIKLIQEELDELKQAFDDNDDVEVADALADILYVVFGTIVSVGLTDKIEAIWAEVQRSNMSKACKSVAEAMDTIDECIKKETKYERSDFDIVGVDDNTFTIKRLDGKVIKSKNYSPANLKQFFDK